MPSPNCNEHLDRLVDELYPRMVELRRGLHANPEPSGEELETTARIAALFDDTDATCRRGPEGRGLIVDSGGRETRPRIALRADIDALWIQDSKHVPYRSQVPGVMHACGHDSHAATVAGALLALRAARRDGVLPASVSWRGIFQPAEETSQGAREMIGCGAIDDVDAVIALHMDPSRRLGTIGVKAGTFTAACDEMWVTIEGRGGHAARPHESIDPIAAAAQFVSSVYLFVPRAVDSLEPVVVTIGTIRGGENPNVIPERVTLRGTVRTLGDTIRDRTQDHIRQLAKGLAVTSGTNISVDFFDGPPSVLNDIALTDLIRRTGAALLGPENVTDIGRPSMGGEDFACYLQRVPGCMFRLGCVSTEKSAPLHSPLFDIDERAMAIGAKVLARAVVAWSERDSG